ncbi:hypothetical protein Bbelb_141060 [Branchiostoma belcheri]|nr:hypothetical protein Bbelb_141060 [Branchiostoma belcheri]
MKEKEYFRWKDDVQGRSSKPIISPPNTTVSSDCREHHSTIMMDVKSKTSNLFLISEQQRGVPSKCKYLTTPMICHCQTRRSTPHPADERIRMEHFVEGHGDS